MRVTTQLMVNNTLRRLSARLEGYEKKQEQLATGRRINRPSDDPSSSSRALVLQSAIRARTQEVRNADDAMTYLDRADSEVQGLLTNMQRVKQLSVTAGGDLGPEERAAVARELEQIRDAMVSIANTTNGGTPMFSGTVDGPAVQQVAGVWTYTGDNGAVQRRVSEQDRITVNTTADQLFGFGSAQGDVFTILDDLIGDLTTDNRAGRSAAIGKLDLAFDGMTERIATIGAVANRVENSRDRTGDAILTLRAEVSEVRDVDLEAAIMDLRVEEIAYEATLNALGRSLPQSLVAFMR